MSGTWEVTKPEQLDVSTIQNIPSDSLRKSYFLRACFTEKEIDHPTSFCSQKHDSSCDSIARHFLINTNATIEEWVESLARWRLLGSDHKVPLAHVKI